MSLPHTLKRFNTFIDGVGFLGETESVQLPKITRAMEAYRAGGMAGPVKIEMGLEQMEAEINFGGFVLRALGAFASTLVDGAQLRWVGSYKSGTSAVAQTVEVSMRGTFEEIDFGTQKAGEKSEQKHKFAVSYYKMIVDGATVFEIDMVRGMTVINGVDIDAAARAAIGA